MGPATWQLARGWALCPKAMVCTVTCNLPSEENGCPRPGCPPWSQCFVICPPSPLVTATPDLSVVTTDGWDGPRIVFCLGVTSRVRMSQDWAFSHTRPQGRVLTKPSQATSSLTGKAGLPWGAGEWDP